MFSFENHFIPVQVEIALHEHACILRFSSVQGNMSTDEIDNAIHTDSRHADRLRSIYASKESVERGFVQFKRIDFIGSRRSFEMLKRVSGDNSNVYELLIRAWTPHPYELHFAPIFIDDINVELWVQEGSKAGPLHAERSLHDMEDCWQSETFKKKKNLVQRTTIPLKFQEWSNYPGITLVSFTVM